MADAVKSVAAPLVIEQRDGGVALLVLNRPERLNALNVELSEALLNALRRTAADEAVRCVVLTGAGRAFCSGGDLKLLHEARVKGDAEALAGLLAAGMEIPLAICSMSKPVLAAVNGPAAGAGMSLALACDARIASDTAMFGQNFARVGLYPDFGATFFLPRLAGAARAAELFYTGEMIPAAEAERCGIVNRIVPAEKFESETRALAAKLAAAPPRPAGAVKQLLFASELGALRHSLEEEAARQRECFLTEDCLEGLHAFFEKRAPRFTGR